MENFFGYIGNLLKQSNLIEGTNFEDRKDEIIGLISKFPEIKRMYDSFVKERKELIQKKIKIFVKKEFKESLKSDILEFINTKLKGKLSIPRGDIKKIMEEYSDIIVSRFPFIKYGHGSGEGKISYLLGKIIKKYEISVKEVINGKYSTSIFDNDGCYFDIQFWLKGDIGKNPDSSFEVKHVDI